MPLPVAIGALVLAHLFDLLSFIVLTARHGLAAEANPIVVRLAEELGLPGLTLAKFFAVVLGASVFAVLAPKRQRLAMTVLVFGVGAGLVGGFSNVISL
jgi:asparagine N-glycosylation enzyme membrane subunit Stt3